MMPAARTATVLSLAMVVGCITVNTPGGGSGGDEGGAGGGFAGGEGGSGGSGGNGGNGGNGDTMGPAPCPSGGCPSGQKCTLVQGLVPGCARPGSGGAGTSCTQDSECMTGTWCDKPLGGGRCVAFCADANDTSCATTMAAGSVCIPLTDGFSQVAAFCTMVCDPFTATSACTEAEDCKLVDNSGHGGCFSLAAMPAAEGEDCTYINDCARGLDCLTAGGSGTCHHVCNSTHMCPSGGTCTAFAGSSDGLGGCSN